MLNGNNIHVNLFALQLFRGTYFFKKKLFRETTEWDDKNYSLRSQISNSFGVVLSQSFQSLITSYFLCVEFRISENDTSRIL